MAFSTEPSVRCDVGLLKHPCLNLVMPRAEQVDGAAVVVFPGDGAGLMPHDLRNNAGVERRWCGYE